MLKKRCVYRHDNNYAELIFFSRLVLPNQAFPVPIVSPGSGPVFEREPRCSGSEQNLTECSFDDIGPLTKRQVGPGPEGDNDCNSHQNDVSIICGGTYIIILYTCNTEDHI